jgi:uncharacterized protein YjdB
MFYVTASTAVKKERGKAKCKNLSYYVVKNGPFVLNIRNRHWTLIGENVAWFASKIGRLSITCVNSITVNGKRSQLRKMTDYYAMLRYDYQCLRICFV